METESKEVLDLAVIETALIDPTTTRTDAALALLKKEFSGLIFDVSTPAGIESARVSRRTLVSLRTTGDKKRLELNKPEKEKIDRRNSEWRRIEGVIVELETPIDKTIKDREAEIEGEREKKRELERQRITAIQARIDIFRNAPLMAATRTSEEIGHAIVKIGNMAVDDSYQELVNDAIAAKKICIESLGELQATVKATEEEAARIEAERLETARLEAEEREAIRLAQEAESNRLAAIRIEQEAAAERERERLADEKAEHNRKMLIEKAELDRIADEQAEALAIAQKRLADQEAERKRQWDAVEAEAAAKQKEESDRLAAERAELERQQEAMAEALRQQEEVLAAAKIEEEAPTVEVPAEVNPAKPEDFDIILRHCSAGWLGITGEYRTGAFHRTAALALKAVEKYLATA